MGGLAWKAYRAAMDYQTAQNYNLPSASGSQVTPRPVAGQVGRGRGLFPNAPPLNGGATTTTPAPAPTTAPTTGTPATGSNGTPAPTTTTPPTTGTPATTPVPLLTPTTGTGTTTPTTTTAATATPALSSDPATIQAALLTAGSPYIDVAKSQATDAANRRGLFNSSIAAGAGQRAAIEASMPIVQQTAQQRADVEAQAKSYEQQTALQATDIASQKSLAEMSTASQEKIAQENRATQESIAQLDAATKTNLANLDVETQKFIKNMEISVNQQSNAASMAASMASTDAQMFAAIMANEKISSSARATYLQNIKAQTASNLGLLEQIYNIDLRWAQSAEEEDNAP